MTLSTAALSMATRTVTCSTVWAMGFSSSRSCTTQWMPPRMFSASLIAALYAFAASRRAARGLGEGVDVGGGGFPTPHSPHGPEASCNSSSIDDLKTCSRSGELSPRFFLRVEASVGELRDVMSEWTDMVMPFGASDAPGEGPCSGITASPMVTGCLVTGVPLCLGSAVPVAAGREAELTAFGDAAVVMAIPEDFGASDARWSDEESLPCQWPWSCRSSPPCSGRVFAITGSLIEIPLDSGLFNGGAAGAVREGALEVVEGGVLEVAEGGDLEVVEGGDLEDVLVALEDTSSMPRISKVLLEMKSAIVAVDGVGLRGCS